MTINWANIASGWSSNFKKYSSDQVATIGSYDYGSVMHYSRCAASKNNRETITAKVNKWVQTKGTDPLIMALYTVWGGNMV